MLNVLYQDLVRWGGGGGVKDMLSDLFTQDWDLGDCAASARSMHIGTQRMRLKLCFVLFRVRLIGVSTLGTIRVIAQRLSEGGIAREKFVC
jgi:hypothetical protein